jgi:hypothetical protein
MKYSMLMFILCVAFAFGALLSFEYGDQSLAIYCSLVSIRFALAEAVEKMKED